MIRQLILTGPCKPSRINYIIECLGLSAKNALLGSQIARPQSRCFAVYKAFKSKFGYKPLLGFVSLGATGLFEPTPERNQMRNITDLHIGWTTFCHQLLGKGEVKSLIIRPGGTSATVILHPGALVDGKQVPFNILTLEVSNINNLEERIREFEASIGIRPNQAVPIEYQSRSVVPMIVAGIIMVGFTYMFFKNAKLPSGGGFSSFSKAKFTLVDSATRTADGKSINFKDVAGLREAKIEISEFVDYLKDSERFIKLGAKLPKGVLLTGPPGCGKTLLAKAVATEANVPFLAMAGSEFVEMIGGVGASRVRNLFKSARKLSPCIIYIDEIDSIGRQRGDSAMAGGDSEQTLNQLLVEMDGMKSRKGVILLASTNRAEVLDKALTRPGRFDRQILIDLPNMHERREIFEKHASSIKLSESPSSLSHRISQLTPGMSGADLANVCNEAALHAARKDKRFVTNDDLEYAIERVVGGTEKRSSSMSAEERKIIAYHESGHALAGWLLEHTDPVLKVSIVPRTTNILGYAQYVPSDQKLYSPEQVFDRMCMALGGRVAEVLKFNHLSTGAQDDLKKVTQMAMAQITEFGFDSVVGNLSFPKDSEGLGRKPYSKQLANLIDHRASLIVKKAFDTTVELLNNNSDKLKLLAETLIAKEVINSSDIEKLIGPRPYRQRESTA